MCGEIERAATCGTISPSKMRGRSDTPGRVIVLAGIAADHDGDEFLERSSPGTDGLTDRPVPKATANVTGLEVLVRHRKGRTGIKLGIDYEAV